MNLAWTDNSEPDLSGYNVYRFVAPSTYTKINTSLLASPAYVATGLTNGTAYTYVVTAVDGSTNESGYSSPSTATPAEAATGLQFASASANMLRSAMSLVWACKPSPLKHGLTGPVGGTVPHWKWWSHVQSH